MRGVELGGRGGWTGDERGGIGGTRGMDWEGQRGWSGVQGGWTRGQGVVTHHGVLQ